MKSFISLMLIISLMITAKAQQPFTTAREKIFKRFETIVQKDPKMSTGILLIHSDSLNIHWKTAVNGDTTVNTHPDQPYHFASIGKTTTAVMIGILHEKGLIDFNDPINKYLDKTIIQGLHVYKGREYSDQLLVKQLLNHTSGLPDYYMDKAANKQRLLELMLSDPNRFWTPQQTINWSKEHLQPKFKPGKGFHYSDTNYQLLGLIIEHITGLPLHEAYQQYIFDPLNMQQSYLIWHSEPKSPSIYPMVDLYHGNLNLSQAKSISMSWASGGIVSTSEDMLKFLKAIVNHKVITEKTLYKMQNWVKMAPNIRYAYGLMKFRFLMMPKKYDIWGNSGSIGAFMYYNPAMDVYTIGSFHKLNCQVQPIYFIFKVLRTINKAK